MTCDLNVAVPLLSSVYREERSLRSLDKSTFCEDLRTVLPPSDCSADQIDSALQVLDKHTPVYGVDAGSVEPGRLHGNQRSLRSYVTLSRADVELRKWLKTGLIAHKQVTILCCRTSCS